MNASPAPTHRGPHLIGICGNPKSGKSLVQQILLERFFVLPVDDGYALRDFAMRNLGLTWDDTHTQEGKVRFTEILGTRWQNRKILGELGNVLEELFGDHIMPFMATRNLSKEHSYSFGSVRKNQGEFYKANGGIIIGIKNPVAPPTAYEFDKFEHGLVDIWIENDAQHRMLPRDEALADLTAKVIAAVGPLFTPITAVAA